MSQEKSKLIPLQIAFDERIQNGDMKRDTTLEKSGEIKTDPLITILREIKASLPPQQSEVRCISHHQEVAFISNIRCVVESPQYGITSPDFDVLATATAMWNLAIKRCVACKTKDCPFREK